MCNLFTFLECWITHFQWDARFSPPSLLLSAAVAACCSPCWPPWVRCKNAKPQIECNFCRGETFKLCVGQTNERERCHDKLMTSAAGMMSRCICICSCSPCAMKHDSRGQKATGNKCPTNQSKVRNTTISTSENHFIKTISFFFSFSSRKISDKKSKDSIAGDYPESCSICHRNPAAGASDGSESAANGPLLLTSCGNCSASICTSPACAIRSAIRDSWECNECHRQRLDTATGYLQAYDWIFERLNRKFSERATSAISSNKSEAERRRCCSNVMWSSNGKSICLVCVVVVAGRLIAPMLTAPLASGTIDSIGFSLQASQW